MTSIRLQDIASIHGGGRLKLSGNHFVSEGVPAYGAGGRNGFVATAEYADRDAVILSSIGARCGKCFHVSGAWTSLANTQVILPNPSRVVSRFLWYQLNDEARWPRSGSAQPFIKPSDVKAHEVWLPPLDEQRRIASILDGAGAIRAKRREALAQLDRLVESVYELGIAARAATYPVEVFAALVSDAQIGLVRSAALQGSDREFEYLRMDSITRTGGLDLSSVTLVDASEAEAAKFEVRDGDLLFNTRNTRELVGKTVVYRGAPRLYNNNLMRIRFNEQVIPEYVHRYLWSRPGQQQLEARKSGTTSVFAIYAKSLGDLKVPVPPLELQREFACQLASIDVQRAAMLSALEIEDELFTSMQSKAFRGEL